MEGQKEEEKKNHSNSRLSRKQGVKLAEELPNKCVCVCVYTQESLVLFTIWFEFPFFALRSSSRRRESLE